MRSVGVGLALVAALAASAMASISTGARGKRMVAVGTYTNAREQGIFLYRWDEWTATPQPRPRAICSPQQTGDRKAVRLRVWAYGMVGPPTQTTSRAPS